MVRKTTIRIAFNGGDNMLGRGVQLSLPNRTPGEELVKDSMEAIYYAQIALNHGNKDLSLAQIRTLNKESASYLWGDQINIKPLPDLTIMNLETSLTNTINNLDVPFKGINYHLNIENFKLALKGLQKHKVRTGIPKNQNKVGIVFSNNHVLDFGRMAFENETLPFISQFNNSEHKFIGAGSDFENASEPCSFEIDDLSVQVFAVSCMCSGTPPDWLALDRQDWTTDSTSRSGIVVIPPIDSPYIDQAYNIISGIIKKHATNSNGVRVLSIHWGPNWAYRSGPDNQKYRQMLAHKLIDNNLVDVIYGHSSHHIRGFEKYKDKLIIYGAGDFINDYEGFENRGDEVYDKSGGIIIVDLNAEKAILAELRIVPMFMDRLQLKRLQNDSNVWRPNSQSMKIKSKRVEDLAEFINAMSELDVGLGRTEKLKFRVVEDDIGVPGGPILVYP